MRAVAATSVVLAHVWLYAHDYLGEAFTGPGRFGAGLGLGVMLFFALTGYLLYRPFARRDFGGGGPVRLLTYARNRVLRILPLYWTTVVILLLLTQHGGTANQWWRFLTFSESFSLSTAQKVDGPMWSLVVEVHFYILLPILAFVVGRVSGRRAPVAATLLVLFGAASVWFAHLGWTPAYIWQYSLPYTFYGFVPGMLLAVIDATLSRRADHRRRSSPSRWWTRLGRNWWRWLRTSWWTWPLRRRDLWLAAAIGLWIVVCLWPRWEAPVVAGATFMALGAVVLPLEGGLVIRLLDLRPLAAVGVASYSLYLWHVPIITHVWTAHGFEIGTGPLLFEVLPVSLVVAGLSYTVIERPALSLRGRWFGRGRASAAGGVP